MRYFSLILSFLLITSSAYASVMESEEPGARTPAHSGLLNNEYKQVNEQVCAIFLQHVGEEEAFDSPEVALVSSAAFLNTHLPNMGKLHELYANHKVNEASAKIEDFITCMLNGGYFKALKKIFECQESEWIRLDLCDHQTLGFSSYNNSLKVLPPEIGLLTSLRELILINSELRELPLEIGLLTNLRELILINSELRELPPEIGLLTSLRELDISFSKSIELSPELGQLKNLSKLNVSRNDLTDLPAVICLLTNLRKLNLNGNNLTDLPPEFDQLTNLRELDVSWNKLTGLPDAICQITNLVALDLSQNKLRELPPKFSQLENLEEIILTNNLLTGLPPEIGSLKNLQQLDVSWNTLTVLPDTMRNLANLRALNLYCDPLACNTLDKCPLWIADLSSLEELMISTILLPGDIELNMLGFVKNIPKLQEFLRAKHQRSNCRQTPN